MALAFGATIYNGVRCKIFTITCLDNDAAADLAVAFNGAGGRPTALPAAPLEASYHVEASTDFDLQFMLTGLGAGGGAGLTIRKLTAAGAGGNVTVRVFVRIPRGIAG